MKKINSIPAKCSTYDKTVQLQLEKGSREFFASALTSALLSQVFWPQQAVKYWRGIMQTEMQIFSTATDTRL